MIPYYKPAFGKEELKAAARVIKSGYLAQGPEVEAFEHEYSAYCGGAYCVAVSSATAGLYLVSKWHKNHGLEEIDIPAYTFCATYQAPLAAGLKVNILDVNEYYNIRSGNATIQVLFCGTRRIYSVCLFDAAHCFPFESAHDRVYSFYPTKPLGSNGGGMIVTSNKELADWCRLMRQHGRTEAVGHAENPASIGFNFWMSSLNASIAREQLKKIDYLKEARAKITQIYYAALSGKIDCYYGDHLFLLRFPRIENTCSVKKSYNFDFLKEKGIGFSRPYIPLADRCVAPNAWDLYDRSVSIPFYPGLNKRDQSYIIKAVRSVL